MTKNTKDKIFETALDLFSQKGYSAVSIREITRTVGIKESSLYNHYKNKEQILESILTHFRTDFSKTMPPLEALDEILNNSTTDAFFKAGHRNFKTYMENVHAQKMWRVLQVEQFREPMARDIILNDFFQSTIDFLEIVFKKLIKMNRIKPVDPRLLAVEYQYPAFSLLAEYNILKFDGKDTTEVERRLDQHIDFFLEMVKVPQE
ncbi:MULTISPECIES: TetR/AcrR family transcriptional regulator [Bacillaceae]|uniref:TetR/AcrR family transcriptional regulator n=1 Tax=Bacillaceae TaxID=186817 RepID=UPI000BFE2ACC|nr:MULTISPECIES: TetR/AcrR family transcriptional regulator [Bacillaceae]PGT84471.1 TetR family transcriptional regulator [Bacillus sp. AFS040349]UGB32924.1 TetR/AcrR family transcriptional regulator [Metabacillus sp. B2-18]UHA59073.1 TetR/AcrR family transcriptional regulator [Metabacillus litoralis]